MEVRPSTLASRFASLLSWLGDGYWPAAGGDDEIVVRSQDARRQYALQRLLASGDVADLHLASTALTPETPYLLKVSRLHGQGLLEIERRTLTRLRAAAGAATYRAYLPALEESFPATAGRRPLRVNVFRFEPELRSLEQVHEQHPALDGRHLAWVFNRLLTVLGFCHRQGIVHGAVLPCHVLVHAGNHGLQLVGWGQSVSAGQRITNLSTRYRDWYPPEVEHGRPAGPASDLFLAARCLVYLAGGDPLTNRLPADVPPPLARFLATCLLDSARMRPDDAWALQEDFAELLRGLYGPPKFHQLILI